MDFYQLLQSILSIFGQSQSDNPVPTPTRPVMNTISIQRGPVEPSAGIFGNGSLSWDTFSFVSLENEALFIPAGTYKMEWRVSEHLGGATVPLLLNVPGRTEILLHWGNYESNSEGCILIGAYRDGDAIDSTETACKTLFAKINVVGIENCQIVIQ